MNAQCTMFMLYMIQFVFTITIYVSSFLIILIFNILITINIIILYKYNATQPNTQPYSLAVSNHISTVYQY